jgi:hypothetical protein
MITRIISNEKNFESNKIIKQLLNELNKKTNFKGVNV